MSIQVCREPADAVALYLPQRLYLKSFAKLNISVQFPPHKVHGKAISNWELMEKLRKFILPDSFSLLKVSKNNSEVIRFDAELEARDKLGQVLSRLKDRVVQLNDYPDPMLVRAVEAKSDFPTRHSWDSFFRDAVDMDEMKPGERPDTIHISNLPIRWFVHDRDRDEDAPPSETVFKKVFEKYGEIRQVDVPAADPYRMQMKETMRGITVPPQDVALYFEGYIQFSEYVSFVRCMDALRGCKLLRKKDDLAEWCSIHVDFDKTKHMTDAAVKRRAIVRERLASRQRAKELEEKHEREKIADREAKERQKMESSEREKLEKMREREERRKKKQLAKLMERDDVDLNKKVAEEQQKLLKVQKKLQAIRLIEELFKRIEIRPELQHNGSTRHYYSRGEQAARARIVDKIKRQQERLLDEQRDQLRLAMNGRIVIRSALETKKPKRESSVSSLSSEDHERKRVKTEKLTAAEEHDLELKRHAAGLYGVPNPYAYGYPFSAPHPGYGFPQTSVYYGVRGGYYPAGEYGGRRGGRGRGRGRGRGVKVPYFDGPDASHKYYRYFKRLTENEGRNEHDQRDRPRSRTRTRSRSRSRQRTRTRSRSRSHRRSYTRSRSRSRSRRRSYSRSRSRGRSRRSRSRRSSRSRDRRSRSRRRSRSSRRSRSAQKSHRSSRKSRSKSKLRTPSPIAQSQANVEPATSDKRSKRSKSWSQPKEAAPRRSWSKTPEDKL